MKSRFLTKDGHLSNTTLYLLYLLLAVCYLLGTFIPLMENDSAQHAVMAMRMYLENDFVNLYRGNEAYLDKPHMHFWLAGLAFKIFGISQWAYRIPALLFTIGGAYAVFRLTTDLYKNVPKAYAHYAALIFLTAQAIVLSNHDVRTDAVLTGAVIISLWQLFKWVEYNQLKNVIWGALFMGIAFSTKGLLGLVVIGLCLISHIAYTNKWNVFLRASLWAGFITLLISISPMLYAYYLQFDLHPELVVNEQTDVSGIRFILWDQSFNRLTAKGFEEVSPDYLFFFHTILWAFLPWPLLFYTGMFRRLKALLKARFDRSKYDVEVLTLGGIVLTLLVISFSKFKLPHYLNSLMPVMAIFTAGFLYTIREKEKLLRSLLIVQYVVAGIGILAVLGVLFLTFETPGLWVWTGAFSILGALLIAIGIKADRTAKIVLVTVLVSVLINFSLNAYFYQHLLTYQSGKQLAQYYQEELSEDYPLFIPGNEYRWSLDFYTRQNIPSISPEGLKSLESPVIIATNNKEHLLNLAENDPGISAEIVYSAPDFRITRLSLKFLNKETREALLDEGYLVLIGPNR
ncbi:ArnT family glycosyltransferase [Robertkochia aurantiaca]|uniref:ArnT family glycosyltransferase n=1 Tax=Robertkochia aurantiaca TaxID=2873700 RepID=UPI001CCB6072|nr:glycosyltransferase family 39 protein [Robertkochia sp. 3YJGBD-33]